MWQIKAMLEGTTMVVGYGNCYMAALEDCEKQFDLIPQEYHKHIELRIVKPDDTKQYVLWDELGRSLYY